MQNDQTGNAGVVAACKSNIIGEEQGANHCQPIGNTPHSNALNFDIVLTPKTPKFYILRRRLPVALHSITTAITTAIICK